MTAPEDDDLIEIDVASAAWRPLGPERLTVEAVRAALRAAGVDAAACAVSVKLTDDDDIARLNAAFRGTSAPTNVLSWPSRALSAPLAQLQMSASDAPTFLGDVAASFHTLEREAARDRKTLEDHARHLIVHGVLHLLGYDHQDDASAEVMEAREIEALASLGIADPYAAQPAPEARDG